MGDEEWVSNVLYTTVYVVLYTTVYVCMYVVLYTTVYVCMYVVLYTTVYVCIVQCMYDYVVLYITSILSSCPLDLVFNLRLSLDCHWKCILIKEADALSQHHYQATALL